MPRSVLLVVAILGALAVLGCGREASFPDRTARIALDGDTSTFSVENCLLDGQTAYVVGRADDGRVVQAVVGVEADGETGIPTSTGISVTNGETGVAAFGEEAWARRGEDGTPPGAIASARIRGARIQAEGRAQPTGPDDRPRAGPAVEMSFDARCDEQGG